MEFPLIEKKWKKGMFTMDFVYPNMYYGGIYCLAVHIFYNLVMNKENWILNRIFLDKNKITSNFIGFTLQYEPDYYNVFKILKENNIPLEKENRKQIIFAGGPCINSNPKTMEKYFDFFLIGSAEIILEKILDVYEEDQNKKSFLKKISKLKGVYVPGISKELEFAYFEDPNNMPYPLYQPMPTEMDKKYVFGKCFILEIERGCPFQCKFCVLPQLYSKVKHRSLDNIKEIIDKGTKINKRNKVIIYTPSFSHPKRNEILQYMLDKKIEFSIPSIKAELVDEELMKILSKSGQKTLTVAPECNESLRKSLNKYTTDKQFFKVIELANKYNIKKLKYYFMINLPNQTEEDLKETLKLMKELKDNFKGKTYFSINATIPKPRTEIENHTYNKKEIKKQKAFLEKELKKMKVQYKFSSISLGEKEYKLAHAKQVKPLQ